MRGIAGKKDAPGAPAVGHPGMKGVDHFALEHRPVVGAVKPQQFVDVIGRKHHVVLFAVVQHEFEAARAVRTGQRQAWPRRIAVDFGVMRRIGCLLEVDNQPALAKGRAVHLNAKALANKAAAAIAGDKIVAGQIERRAGFEHPQADRLGGRREFEQLGFERGGHIAVTPEIFPQQPLQHRLAESIAARKAIFQRCRLDLEEPPSAQREILGAVAEHDVRHQLVDYTDRLHGAQRLVVDRHRARFSDGLRVAFDDQNVNAIAAEQAGKRQTRRAGAGNDDRPVGTGVHVGACRRKLS